MTTPIPIASRPEAPRVRALRPGEAETAAQVLVEAFDRDPIGQWLYPDPVRRRAEHADFFRSVVADSESGSIVEVTDDLDAIAIWHPPGSRAGAVPTSDLPPAAQELFRAIERSEPDGPFWYLDFLGARTSGRGGGSALLRHRLAEVRGLSALWTGNARNLGFYGRLGYAPVAHVAVEGAQAWWLTRS